jgi:hypothetical protein
MAQHTHFIAPVWIALKNDLIRLFQVTYNKISALFGISEVRPFLARTVLGWLSRRTKACRFFGLFGLARY